LYSSQNNYEAPEPLYQRALKIYENIHGPDHPYTAMSLNNLALVYMAQGNFEAAEPRFQQALSIYEKVHGPDHPDTALSLNNLASLHYSQNNYEASERLYQRSLKIYENVHGPDHPDIAMSLNNLALLRETNDQPGVGELLDRARRGAFRHVSRVLPALIENEQRLFLKEKFEPEVHMALSWALYHPDDPKVVSTSLAWVANSKGVAQEAAATRNLMLSEALDPKLLAIVRELQSVQKQLAAIAMTLADQSTAEQRLARINELTQKESQLTKQLALATSADGDRKAWIETEPLRRAIPPDSVLVDIARFDQFDFRETSTENKWKPAHYAAWITPTLGEGEPTLIDLGLADEIDALVQSIRVAIQADGSEKGAIEEKGEAEAADQLNASMKKLSEKIWDPIVPCVGDAESILLSPDGGLWLAPWSALPTGENEDLLIKKHSLRLLIRGRDLLAKRDSPVKSAAPVIFADPKFDSSAVEKKTAIKAVLKKLPEKDDGTLRSFSAKGLLPKVRSLPNTAIEASLVGPNLEKIANGKPIAYQERYALESIAKVLKRPKVAVFATHGFFLPSQEVKKDDLMRGIGSNETRSALLDTSGKPIENPLLRCGLLLAGCNARGSAVGDDDGILTGMEITTIDLRGTDMVVLSACETGVGDVKNGEGVAGLRQAFQLAGARTVVSTLWQIPDRDSAIIMNDFFENVAAGQSASEAMRQAQLKRIKSRSSRFGAAHPFFWAAWTVTE
jgi:CHAT domain-containing protein